MSSFQIPNNAQMFPIPRDAFISMHAGFHCSSQENLLPVQDYFKSRCGHNFLNVLYTSNIKDTSKILKSKSEISYFCQMGIMA